MNSDRAESTRILKIAMRLRQINERLQRLNQQACIQGRDPDFYRSVIASQSMLATETGLLASSEKSAEIKKCLESFFTHVRSLISKTSPAVGMAVDFENFDFGSDNPRELKAGLEKFHDQLSGKEMKEDVARDIREHAAARSGGNVPMEISECVSVFDKGRNQEKSSGFEF